MKKFNAGIRQRALNGRRHDAEGALSRLKVLDRSARHVCALREIVATPFQQCSCRPALIHGNHAESPTDTHDVAVEIKIAPDPNSGHRVWIHVDGQLVCRVYKAVLHLDVALRHMEGER